MSDPLGQINGYISEELGVTDYLRVQRVPAILQKRVDQLFDQFDVLATAGSDHRGPAVGPRPACRSEPAFDTAAARSPSCR